MKKKWEYYEQDKELVEQIAKKHNISTLLAKILINRNIVDEEEINVFLNPKRNNFHDPFLMLDMDKAVDRIIKAIKNKEKTIIYGDYDVDGITSITVLKKFLSERGLEVDYYIPNRLEEGYGLNKDAIQEIAKQGYTLMITVDCGISGINEIEMANSLGIETIITDHHEQLDSLPQAYCIINPKRKDNTYPFRGLAGVGVVFKLIQAISIKLGLDEKAYLKYLDIVCIGTISDIVPLVDENRVIAKLGLMLVKVTKNIGLKELITQTGYSNIDSSMVSFGIAPRINACGRMGKQEEALKLFITDDKNEANEITKKLNEYNIQRQEKEKNIFYGVLINMICQLTLIIMIGVAMKQYLITSFKKFKADRISVNIKRVLAGVGIAYLLSGIARIIQMTMCSNISVSANQSNVNGYFVDYPILAVIMSVIMGPFTEEIIYRGILFRFFSKYGELCAVLSTGFLFGTMHMLSSFGNTNILLFLCQWLDYFLSGILLGFIYKKYKNIWINVSIHGTWNLIVAVIILTQI